MTYLSEPPSSLNSDRAPVLVDPQLLKYLQLGVHCKVQLVSSELELDSNEVPVPVDYPVIEILALDDKRETIEAIVASMPEYTSYRVVDSWLSIVDCPF